MAVHDWTRVDAGVFHDHHFCWLAQLKVDLNQLPLDPSFYAMLEPCIGLAAFNEYKSRRHDEDGPPDYVPLQRRICVRHGSGDGLAARVEMVCPGNLLTPEAAEAYVARIVAAIREGIHGLLVEILLPDSAPPQGMERKIVPGCGVALSPFDAALPLTVASLCAGTPVSVEFHTLAVGQVFPRCHSIWRTPRAGSLRSS